MREEGLDDVPVVVGGIIPPEDAAALKGLGVAAVYTPKDFQLNDIMARHRRRWWTASPRRLERGCAACAAQPGRRPWLTPHPI